MSNELDVIILKNGDINSFNSLKMLNYFAKFHFEKKDMYEWNVDNEKRFYTQAIFIGKTGYGKSSTLNRLCGEKLFLTDDIASCTKELFSVDYQLDNDYGFFSLCDLPGIGESIETDKEYFNIYARMLSLSHCIVYVLRADQRDFSIDEVAFKSLALNGKEMIKKLIVAINFVDKIEPISDTIPFSPTPMQQNNLNKKVFEIMRVFEVDRGSIVCYSAKHGYGVDLLERKILEKITDAWIDGK